MPKRSSILFAAIACLALLLPAISETREQWTAKQANAWYEAQPWRVGSNYVPATAINESLRRNASL